MSYKNQASAKANEFKDGWAKMVQVKGKSVYRVFVGKFTDTTLAEKRNSELKASGTEGFVKQVEN